MIGMRLASAAVAPLLRKLFVTEGRGAGVVDKPIRISGYVSLTGEKRSLTAADVRELAAKLVRQALRTGERPIPADEEQAVADALATTLHALGDLTITDLDAVRLGHRAFARELRRAGGGPERELSADATYFYERLLDAACLHILHFFTQRSTFVAHTLVEQTRAVGDLTAKVDELIRRNPLPGGEDAAFEQGYLRYVAKKHGRLTIYGIDLNRSPARWPLDVAYLSLEVTSPIAVTPFTSPWHQELALPRELFPAEGIDAAMQSTASSWEATLTGRGLEVRHVASGPRLADQALADSPRVLLRGEAGSGKTTLVQWLAVTAAGQEFSPRTAYLHDRIPFVLPLRRLTRQGGRLPMPKGFLEAVGCNLAGTQPPGWEHRVLAAGRGLVLVDGIDEVPERERERTRAWLSELMDQYAGDNRWLVTSRPSAVGEEWLAEEDFSELTLSAMGPAEVATFIRRWHAAARPDAEDPAELDAYERGLITAVRTKPDLGRLATNPLMCGLVCALHRERRGYLPHGRKELYEAALSMLLSRRDRERDIEVPDLGEDAQLDLLQRLAYWLIKNGRTEMARPRADDIIGRALPAVPELAALGDAGAVFERFLLRSGLLREPAPDAVEFVHKTFQDFLGARAAVEEGDFGLLISRAGDDQWEDVIRMAVALAKPRERAEILRGLLAEGDRASDQRTRSRVYLLAAACLEQATVLDPGVRDLVEQRTAGLIPPGSAEEARALAEVGPLILGLLPGPEGLDNTSAWHVVVAASNVVSGAAIPFLAQFAEHPDLAVRSQLMWAWSRFDSTEYADEVIARLKPDDLMYTVQSDEQLDQLNRLRLRPGLLDFRAGVSIEALRTYLSTHSISTLTLSHDAVHDLEFLAGQDELHSLVIRDCPALVSLAGIGRMPLRMLEIGVASPQLDLSPVSGLGQLESLAFYSPSDMAWDFGMLPAGDTLHTLRLRGGLKPVHGLTGLAAYPQLRRLALSPELSPGSAEDWRELGSLPRLTNLLLDPSSFEELPEQTVLAGVTDLVLVDGGNDVLQAAIHRLPGAFPQLGVLDIVDHSVTGGHLDLAPLAGLAFLGDVFVPLGRDGVRGAHALRPVVKVHPS